MLNFGKMTELSHTLTPGAEEFPLEIKTFNTDKAIAGSKRQSTHPIELTGSSVDSSSSTRACWEKSKRRASSSTRSKRRGCGPSDRVRVRAMNMSN